MSRNWFKHKAAGRNTPANRFSTARSARVQAFLLCALFVVGTIIQSPAALAFSLKSDKIEPKALAVAKPAENTTGKNYGDGISLEGPVPGQNKTKRKQKERTDLRTANTKTFDSGDGTSEVRNYMGRTHYKQDGKWQDIDTTLVEDANASDSTNFLGKTVAWVKGKTQDLSTYKVKANDWQARFAASDDPVGMLRIQADGQDTSLSPKQANSVKPYVYTQDGGQYVRYQNLWDGIDVEYKVGNDTLKEYVIIRKSDAPTEYSFVVKGANLSKKSDGSLQIGDSKQTFSSLSVSAGKRGIISEPVATQTVKGEVLRVSLDTKWFSDLPKEDFPVVVDPSWGRGTATVSWNYTAYKSDGYACPSTTCFMNAGYLYDAGWKGWRSAFRIDFNVLQGKQLLDAYMHLHKSQRSFWTGTTEGLYTELSHASCLGYNCIDYGAPRHSAWFGTDGDINFTSLMQSRMTAGDWGAWFMLNGEERAYTTYKGWDADNSYFVLSYNSAPGMTTPISPADGQVVVTDQPLLQVNSVGDADGDAPQYYFRIATNSDAETGTVINSGWMPNQTSFTIPEARLQDGQTYWWRVFTYDGYGMTSPNWKRSFKYDSRIGKDSAASFDDAGPVDVNLATGNATTSAATHTTTALGGSIGLNFEYNSPYRSKPGLSAEYFDNTSFSGTPKIKRVDGAVNFDWRDGSPASGVLPNDSFSVRWNGYYVAPETGTYYFGGGKDDSLSITVNNTLAYSAGCCGGSYSATPINLNEGDVVPIKVDYVEATGWAYAQAWVKTPSSPGGVSIPSSWLRTEPRQVDLTSGLMGKYYYDAGNHTFPGNDFESFLQRRETSMSFNWGTGAPAAYAPADNFLVRYSGYFTAPVAGNYQFGSGGDDGTRIFLNGSTTAYRSDWVDRGFTVTYGGDVYLSAGQSIPITAEYYEYGGAAAFDLRVRGAVPEQVIPTTWLSTKVQPLPAGWQMGVDPDGDLSYDYAAILSQSVVLYDAEGDQHEYKWNGSAYVPPVNDYGTLTRNANGTITLLDSDGKTYVFDQAGRITSVTMPTDDLKPAALKYTYGTSAVSGSYTVRLLQISDGVDGGRWGKLYYSGDSQCASAPSGYTTAPANMLCAFITNDGRATNLFYKNGQLARVVASGNETTSLGYDSLGRIISQQSALAYDAVANGVRQDNETVTSQVSYDLLGRAGSVTMPSANEGGFRAVHNYKYLYNATQTNEQGGTEPKGYSQRVDYDALYRTVKNYDKSGSSTAQEWDAVKDLLLSTTDATGLKSTTIFDANDLPVENYGPAPSVWFGADRKPLAAYDSQVPRTSSAYDENITGPAVAWFNYKSASGGAFVGAPRLHTTGYGGNGEKVWLGRDFRAANSTAPFTPEAGMDGYGFTATGKITFPATGTYTFKLWNDDGARLYINDTQLFSNWGVTTEGVAQNIQTGTFAATLGQTYRFKLDYEHTGNPGALELWLNGPGIADVSGQGLGTSRPSFLKPDYNLQTSQTVYGAPTSNGATANLTSKTNYGTNPELGLAQSVTTAFGTPEALTATSSYLDPSTNQQDAYNRQTASSLPGGETTKYTYYGATESVTDDATRCNSGKTYKQGGMLRLKTEPDPDGTGPQAGRTVETIYDDAGKVVATRYNSDPWTCTTYDGRERVLTTSVPAYNGQPARTITNIYAVGGNPLITSSSDTVNGTVQTITVETDLLGRNVKYTDASGNETTSAYDTKGHLVMRVSPLGNEEFTYDSVDRLVSQKLDGTTYATITYDQYSRITSVDYPSGQKLTLTREPDGTGTGGLYGLGRVVGRSYTLPTGQTTTSLSDSVTRAVTGDITSGTELSQTKSYSYDTAGRLVSATVAGNSFTYSYGTQDASCTGKPGIPAGTDLANAGRSSNRTSQTITTPTINGVAGSTTTTTYCYDQADRLVASSNPIYDTATYDSHGNTTKLGNTTGTNTETLFDYDASDRTRQITQNKAGQPSRAVFYYRDVQGRLKTRNVQVNWQNQSTQHYGYTASGDSPDFVRDNSWNITEKYLTLPGDVLLTIRPTEPDSRKQKTYSLPNIHGDIFATTNTNGILTSTTQTGPFGEVLSASTVTIAAGTGTTPNNTKAPNNAVANGGTFAYVGQHEKLTESDLLLNPMQMGSRTYLPGLGRFTSVDPVQGGTPNPYVYPDDPVNDFDLDGTFSLKVLGRMAMKAANIGSFVPGPVGMIASGVLVSSALARGDKAGAMFAAAGMIPGGKAIASTGKLASKLGKAGEVAVARMTGLVKNTTAYQIKGTSRRIPDFVSRSAFHEVKNTARLSLTKQVRETQAIAQHLNKSYFLWTRKNTRMSGPLRKQIQAGNIRHRTLPW